MLIGVTIVAADTIMSFFGSMANDAGYNAWYADMMDDSNSGQIGAVAATLPVIGTLVGTLVFGEPISAGVFLGLACILACVYILR